MSTGTLQEVDPPHLQCNLLQNLLLQRIIALLRFLCHQVSRPGLHPLLLLHEVPLALCRDRCQVVRVAEVGRLSLVQIHCVLYGMNFYLNSVYSLLFNHYSLCAIPLSTLLSSSLHTLPSCGGSFVGGFFFSSFFYFLTMQ